MNRTAQPTLVVIGVLFLLGVPVSVLTAGVYSYFQPRLYSATTEFQLLAPATDSPHLEEAFQHAQRDFPRMMQKPLTARVSLKKGETPSRYEITALELDPLGAASTANVLTLSIADTLRARNNLGDRRMEILQRAELPQRPSHPNVPRNMRIGMIVAALSGVLGVVLLVIGFARRSSADR